MVVTISRVRSAVVAAGVVLGALFLAACHLGGEAKVEATISFNQIFDSLVQYDHVVISLKDKDGSTIDVVFDGKVKTPGDVEKLPAPHWDGGKVTVSIVGFKDGKIVYRTETGFDGANNKKDSIYVFVAPGVSLSYSQSAIPMLEGDSIPLPPITIIPANLKNKDLTWTSSAPDVVRIGATGLKALKAGNAQILASLSADSTKFIVIAITVVDPTKIPESLVLSADTLNLSAGGAPGRLELQFLPTTSAKDVVWSILDTTVAKVSSDGAVQGKKAGETRLIVVSTLKATAADNAVVRVTQPKPPEKVILAKAETEIFVGGAAESLLVSIEPPEANQAVDFTVSAPLLIDLKNGRIRGLAAGDGLVIATSKENPDLTDTLRVKITLKQVVSSVTLSKRTLLLFTGGDEPVLTASIDPSTSNQKVQWRTDQETIVKVNEAGKVTGVSPGHTRIHAISLVDSSKQDSAEVTVKTDAPVVSIGRPDTAVSAGSTVTYLPFVPVQEYGVVVAFRWDVDGITGWDDTAKAVQSVSVKFDQEKAYLLRFYVRDSEGNETIAIKKVTAVVGPVVNIVSPADGAYFNTAPLKIEWKIDNVAQTSGTDTLLKDGANTITRSAKDAAGKVFSTSVTVYLDTVLPAKPIVKGSAGTANGKPTWTWSPGGGGNGLYRIAVDSQAFAGTGIKDTLFIPVSALTEGMHTLYVQERDAAGNWSLPGKFTTVVDFSGPSKPAVKVNVASPSNIKKPTWSWATGGGSGSGVFQYKLNNPDLSSGASSPATDTQFIPPQNLGDGVHTLYVRERDSLGNWSELGSASVTIDTTGPGAPVPLAGASPTRATTPTWSWTSSGSGQFEYRISPDAAPVGPGTVLAAISFTPATGLGDGTWYFQAREKDAAGNWSPWSASSVVVIKAAAPNAPLVSRNSDSTNAPRWTWSTGGNLGNGTFRFHWKGNTAFLGEGVAAVFAPNLTEGTYELCVAERDLIGYGKDSCSVITVDKTAPVVANYSIVDGFITNTSPITIGYTKDGIAESFPCALKDNDSVNCTKTVKDAAGNTTTVFRKVWYRSNVLFVRAGGKGNGSSWDSPLGKLDTLNASPGPILKSKELWIAAGEYSSRFDQFDVASDMGLYGGFSATGYPNSLFDRNPAEHKSTITSYTKIDGARIVLDGLAFANSTGNLSIGVNAATVTVRNCFFAPLARPAPRIKVAGSAIRLEQLNLSTNTQLGTGVIQILAGSGKVDIIGGEYRYNESPAGAGGLLIEGGDVTASGNAIFYGNKSAGVSNQIKVTGGHLNISGCQIQGGIDGISSSSENLTYGTNTSL